MGIVFTTVLVTTGFPILLDVQSKVNGIIRSTDAKMGRMEAAANRAIDNRLRAAAYGAVNLVQTVPKPKIPSPIRKLRDVPGTLYYDQEIETLYDVYTHRGERSNDCLRNSCLRLHNHSFMAKTKPTEVCSLRCVSFFYNIFFSPVALRASHADVYIKKG